MKSTLLRAFAALALIGSSAVHLSCNVNEYCLNCGKPGDGGVDDGLDADDGGDGDADDGGDGGTCINTGPEVCDNKDNDCDGNVDEGALPTIGDACSNQVGECAGGVKQCTNGVVTCSKPPQPEICDLKDNDCNGVPDDGDPGGGAVCGTSVGECVAGTNHCVSGSIQCVGAVGTVGGQTETCNNRDDDCDGSFDEGLGVIGSCPTGTNTGECNIGNLMCVGGTPTCVGAIGPSPELCDGLDQDCDGNATNGFNLTTDPQNCGTCGTVCNLSAQHAFAGCGIVAPNPIPQCTVAACQDGYHNNNGAVADGCEYGPCTISGPEVCDGIDNDCNAATNEATLTPPANLCLNVGECLNAHTAACTGGGFKCTYTDPDVSQAGGVIQPETLCDGKDNDCDGKIDEGQPNKGLACDNGLAGDCRSTGTFQCNALNLNGPAVCVYTTMGPGMSATETCDGRDNNCNGQVDEGASTGSLAGQEWVNIPNTTPATKIMKYEASRPDSGAVNPGTNQTYACSKQGVQPWTNINYPTAVAACTSIGARLCTEAEWQHMCEPAVAFPLAGPTTTTDFAFVEAEEPFANTTIPTGVTTRQWTKIAPLNFNGVTAMQVPDVGISVSAANALAMSSRLDYRFTLAATTSYRVWLRMRSPAANANGPMGPATAATATLAPVSAAGTAVGDLVIVTTWSPTTVSGIPVHTLQPGFTQIQTDTLDDNANDGRLSVAYIIATTAGAQSYQAYSSNVAVNFTGINVIRAGGYDVTKIVAGTDDDTGTGAPNPPSVTLDGTSTVLAIGAWNLSANSTVSVGAPGNGFTSQWDLAGSVRGELAVAVGSSRDPGGFTDDTNNVNGTIAMTIGIGSGTSNSVWVGLNAGTSAGAANATPVVTTSDDQWQWVVSPTLTSGAAGTHTFSIFTRSDGAIVDTIAISRQGTTSPTFVDAWAYQNSPRTAQPTTCNADDYDSDPIATGNQDGVIPTGTLGSCFANQPNADDAFDMSGNVKEWTTARAGGQNPLRGGASNNEVAGTTCSINFTLANDTFFFPNVGFRCCK